MLRLVYRKSKATLPHWAKHFIKNRYLLKPNTFTVKEKPIRMQEAVASREILG